MPSCEAEHSLQKRMLLYTNVSLYSALPLSQVVHMLDMTAVKRSRVN